MAENKSNKFAKQEMFVKEYLVDLNATAAAIRAGYSPRTAQVQSSRLLSNPRVRDEIEIEKAKRSRRVGITQERVLEELASIAFLDPTEYLKNGFPDTGDLINLPQEVRSAIADVFINDKTGECKIKFHDKLKALEMLSKHLGLLKDKIEVSGAIDTSNVIEKELMKDEESKELLKQLYRRRVTMEGSG